MAVFRVDKTKDYTVMSNHHLKNKNLSLKSKGLLSMILSLPEEWNYTTRGLASICKEGVDCIGALLRELENAGYIQRNRLRDERGRITDTEYVIYEFPQEKPEKEPNTDEPYTPLLHTASPHTENPYMDKSDTENPAQYNTNISNSEKNKILNVVNKNQSITSTGENSPKPTNETVDWIDKFNKTRKTVKENISYDSLYEKYKYDRKMLDSIVEIMVDYLCVNRSSVTISGAEYPIEIIRENLLKLDSSHIEYVIDCMNANTTKWFDKRYGFDELWNLISKDRLAAEFVLEIFKIIRGYGGSAICATQDLNDFFALEDGKYGKGIINNAKTKIILNLEDDEAQRVQSIIHLSEAEVMAVTHFERGNGLISTNNNNITVEFKASRLETELITTDRKELRELMEKKRNRKT